MPGVWELARPDDALGARLEGAGNALRRVLGANPPSIERAAELAWRATGGCDPFGRPLFAANAELARPDDPHLSLWHACTLLREHRGDGHVVALQSAGVDPCEAHVLRVAVSGVDVSSIAPYRGWDDDDWDAAARRLTDRGLLDVARRATATGVATHAAIETETDRLALGPVRALGDDGLDELLAVLGPLATELEVSGTIPFPNAVGVPPLRSS